MLHMNATTRLLIKTIEDCLNGVMKDEINQDIIREELDCILIQFPYKRNEDGQPTWVDLKATIFRNGQFKKTYKEVDKEET